MSRHTILVAVLAGLVLALGTQAVDGVLVTLSGGTTNLTPGDSGSGGTASWNGTLYLHTFTTTGEDTFLNLTDTAISGASALVVGGGGGGGGGIAGQVFPYGGGGGKVSNLTGLTIAAGNNSVVVGVGGTGVYNGTAPNGTGGTSSFAGNTALGGGTPVAAKPGRGGTSGSGNLGGSNNGGAAGGGGGDSAVGANAPNQSTGGAGGAGRLGTLTGSYYGGGGGGRASTNQGAGGIGGGGTGAGTAGTANTGGGGGAGANGGSGIVIAAYAPVTFDVLVTASSTANWVLDGGNHALGLLRLEANGTAISPTALSFTNWGGHNLTFNGISGEAGTGTDAALMSGPTLQNIGDTVSIASGATLTINSVLADGNGGGARVNALTKSGSGNLVLTGANTYTGATTVSNGKLKIDTAGTINSTSGLTIDGATAEFMYNNSTTAFNKTITFTQGTLSGTGTIGVAVTVPAGGILAPGASAGTLTIGNSLVLANGSVLEFELDGTNTTVGSGVNDLVTGVTDLTLDGTLNITALSSFSGVTGTEVWRLINYTGTLTDNVLVVGTAPALPGSLYFAVDTSTASQVNLKILPEPATLALMALGGVGLVLSRKRR